MQLTSDYSIKSYLFFYISLGIIFGVLIGLSPAAAAAIMIGATGLLIVANKPLMALASFIILIPFSGTSLFSQSIAGIDGVRPLYILGIFVLFIALLNYRQSIRMPQYAFIFTVAYFILFSVCIFRALPHLGIIGFYRGESVSTSKFLLSSYIRPLIYFMPFLITVRFAKKIKDLEYVANIIILSVVSLSVFLLYLHLFHISFRGNIGQITLFYEEFFGFHRNGLSNFFIIGFPVVLARFFIKRDIPSILCICLTIPTVGLLYSRTAYVTVLFSVILYLIISKRAKFLPVFIIFILCLVIGFSASILERASKGLDSKNRNDITSGRIDSIWLPLINEYVHNPKKLLVGNGRTSILTSDAAKYGKILPVKHPHNMYLEQILDSGILGFSIVLAFFLYVIIAICKNILKIKNKFLLEYHYAILVSMIAYFIAGLTGRSLFPSINNSYFWLITGLSIVLLRIVSMAENNKMNLRNE